MRTFAVTALALAVAVVCLPGHAAPPERGGGHGGGHDGARRIEPPAHGPRGGSPGWHHGYSGYPGYGLGFGLALGYGAAWALSWPSYWGATTVYSYGAPALYPYPYGYVAPLYPAVALSSDLVYVQQPQAEVASPPRAAPAATSYWYYCTEPAGYYPYVPQCAKPWVAVQPQTPPAGSAPAGTAAR